MKPSTTILELLKAGGSVILPNGIKLEGDVRNGYIDILYDDLSGGYTSDGLWDLSEDGLVNAIRNGDEIIAEQNSED